MKITNFNPSPIETLFADIIEDLKEEIELRSKGSKIIGIRKAYKDNPVLVFDIKDADGDEHELVVQFIQRYSHQY